MSSSKKSTKNRTLKSKNYMKGPFKLSMMKGIFVREDSNYKATIADYTMRLIGYDSIHSRSLVSDRFETKAMT